MDEGAGSGTGVEFIHRGAPSHLQVMGVGDVGRRDGGQRGRLHDGVGVRQALSHLGGPDGCGGVMEGQRGGGVEAGVWEDLVGGVGRGGVGMRFGGGSGAGWRGDAVSPRSRFRQPRCRAVTGWLWSSPVGAA